MFGWVWVSVEVGVRVWVGVWVWEGVVVGVTGGGCMGVGVGVVVYGYVGVDGCGCGCGSEYARGFGWEGRCAWESGCGWKCGCGFGWESRCGWVKLWIQLWLGAGDRECCWGGCSSGTSYQCEYGSNCKWADIGVSIRVELILKPAAATKRTRTNPHSRYKKHSLQKSIYISSHLPAAPRPHYQVAFPNRPQSRVCRIDILLEIRFLKNNMSRGPHVDLASPRSSSHERLPIRRSLSKAIELTNNARPSTRLVLSRKNPFSSYLLEQ